MIKPMIWQVVLFCAFAVLPLIIQHVTTDNLLSGEDFVQ